MPKQQVKRARRAPNAGGDVIAEIKQDPNVAPKSTPTCKLPSPDLREKRLTLPLAIKRTRLQNLLIDLPKLNFPLSPPTTFTVFLKLPLELRNKIWKDAAMVPRDINLREILRSRTQ